MDLPILQDVVIILGLSVLIILGFQKLRIPAILGFLLTGIIAGPHGLSLVEAVHEVELLSEVGVIFLLFVIGIEFSLKGLSTIKNTVLWGGLMQVGGTIAVVALATYLLGLPLKEAVFMGFLLSLSSTAIVLKMLQEKGEITSPHGRVSVAILIFQDIVVVPMMLITPLISGQADNILQTIIMLLIKIITIIAVVIVLARYVVPVILGLVVKSKSKELFILTIVVMCFATAWLTSSAGLSLALGAFFAGLIISESEYSHQATANILPFREIFISFFFVSIGMLLDIKFFVAHLGLIHLMAFGVIFLKITIIALTVLLLRYPPRTVFITALSLFQVGEFAFLLSSTGMQYELLSQNIYQYFLAVSIISMGASPFIINYAPKISEFLLRAPIPEKVKMRLNAITIAKTNALSEDNYHDHLVIIGYGINGENLTKAARQANIPYVIIELDPGIIRKAKEKNEPVVYGDAANEVILKCVKVQEARVVVIAISDPLATKNIVDRIRSFTETAYIIVRTRYISEIDENLKLGADEVIPEEFETSIEIFTRVLKKYLVPSDEIAAFINHIRSHNYEMLRNSPDLDDTLKKMKLNVPEMDIVTLSVQQGNNKIVGKTIGQSGLRLNHGITVLAIKRGNRYLTDITPSTTINQDDVLYIFGNANKIAKVNQYLKL